MELEVTVRQHQVVTKLLQLIPSENMLRIKA